MKDGGGWWEGGRQGEYRYCDRTRLKRGTGDLVGNDLEQQRQQKDQRLAAGILAFEENAGKDEGGQPEERLVEDLREC